MPSGVFMSKKINLVASITVDLADYGYNPTDLDMLVIKKLLPKFQSMADEAFGEAVYAHELVDELCQMADVNKEDDAEQDENYLVDESDDMDDDLEYDEETGCYLYDDEDDCY